MERLPRDITTNILGRLHWKQSYQCRCVSKLWCRILYDPNFPKIQFTQLSTISPDLLLHFKAVSSVFGSRMYYLEDNEALNKRPLKPHTELDELFLKDKFDDGHYPLILGSCNGFVCLLNPIRIVNGFGIFNFPCHPIYILNPITEEHSKLPSFPIPEFHTPDRFIDDNVDRLTDKWLSGFGFESLNKEFKLVIVLFVGSDYKDQIFKNEVQVLTIGRTTWRSKVGIVPNVLHRSNDIASLAVLNGCLHWITVDQSSSALIVLFNLASEEFGFVPAPEIHLVKQRFKYYQLGLLEDCMSLVDSSASYIVIWVMKKYNIKESWVKQFSIEPDSACGNSGFVNTVKLVKIRKNGELLLLLDDMYLLGYDPTSQKSRFLPLGWAKKYKRYYLEAYPLVGSLISLKSAFGMDCDTRRISSTKRKR